MADKHAPMRVLIVTTFFPNAADPQRAIFVKNLVRAMQRRCAVEVISPVPYALPLFGKPEWRAQRAIPACDNIDGIDVRYPRFVVLPKIGWLSGFGYFLGILRMLRRLRQEDSRVVVHAHCAYPDAVGVALAAKLLRLPYTVTAHGSDINVYAERPALRLQIRWALSRAAGIIAVSGALEAQIQRLMGAGKGRIQRIPCAAFDPDVFFPRPQQSVRVALDLHCEGRLVLFVGQLVRIKGVEFLIDAWTELHRRGKLGAMDRLVLLGDGPSRNTLAQQAMDAGMGERVHFAGAMSQAEVSHWIAAASLLCLPSRNEGTPNVVVEALASGVPVVASRVGGIPELIRDGENGLLVPPTDVSALADALEHALARDWNRTLIAESVACRTWQAIADRNCDFLRSILDDHDSVA